MDTTKTKYSVLTHLPDMHEEQILSVLEEPGCDMNCPCPQLCMVEHPLEV
jgi:hypothetical protein